MDITNARYKNQGIHGIAAIFTVEDSQIKVLLIKRKKEPYIGKWILTGGAIYNDETVDDGVKRELKEKVGITDIYLERFGVFSYPYRSPQMRMVAISYVALINKEKVEIYKETAHTSDADWFNIKNIPQLGYDHKEILDAAIQHLKKIIQRSSIVKTLLPERFTIPELQRIYEILLEKDIDRRNFRKKLLGLGLVEETVGPEAKKVGKPAKYYKFREKAKEEKSIF
jgi:8-oxo-dGTP diphosphatase